MSRKLIYVAALLACFRCHLDYSAEEWKKIRDDQGRRMAAVEYLERSFGETPLEITADVLLRFDHLNGAARRIFGAYDEFVGILADDSQRKRLDELREEDATDDPIHRRARRLSHDYRDGLLEFFFDKVSGMEQLTQNYGVF